ncbi:ankyrin repeat protein [Seminavis robusta]|uniref:Ankyrin repeat protein n=1 Tax=Seminavis robusta TaxID=568900 RepID=A0A9N8F3P0_9STRA|nr:ankyrin repeat protein [Seminavis robusta]|eukprot:Sro2762_g336480.1 ankyrin repeat protein (464) ;mRNA; f:6683-8152
MNTATATNDEVTSTAESPLLFADDLIWCGQILSFVGVGQYAFVGAVNKKMNRLNKEYCQIELNKNPIEIKLDPGRNSLSRPAKITDTLYSETFCNEPRAEYWLSDNSDHKEPAYRDVCNVIATIGNTMVMQWVRQNGLNPFIPWESFPWNEMTSAYAAENGHLELLQWLKENGCPWDSWTCHRAASGGHLEILKWARENGCPWNEYTCACAAENGNLEILKWARENDCPWNEQTCSRAAKNGHLDILEWVHENGCPWNEATCSGAAEGGHMEILSGLVKMVVHGVNIHAIKLRRMPILNLKWARANGCPWNESTCSDAASPGHLEILKWARANGCPWNAYTCAKAALHGHLGVLKWARENGCSWNENTCSWAAWHGHFETLRWALENGCPWDEGRYGGSNKPEVIQWLRDNGFPGTEEEESDEEESDEEESDEAESDEEDDDEEDDDKEDDDKEEDGSHDEGH